MVGEFISIFLIKVGVRFLPDPNFYQSKRHAVPSGKTLLLSRLILYGRIVKSAALNRTVENLQIFLRFSAPVCWPRSGLSCNTSCLGLIPVGIHAEILSFRFISRDKLWYYVYLAATDCVSPVSPRFFPRYGENAEFSVENCREKIRGF